MLASMACHRTRSNAADLGVDLVDAWNLGRSHGSRTIIIKSQIPWNP